jgi:hypothetical protein
MLVIEGDSKSQCRGRTFAREWLNRRAVSASCAEPFEPAPVVVSSSCFAGWADLSGVWPRPV